MVSLLNESDVYFMLGMSYYQLESLPYAQANLQRAVELNPVDIDARFQYGLTLAQLELIGTT